MYDHAPNLGSRLHSPPLQLKALSKEQFFTTKKNNKRMKSSACFSENQQPSPLLQEGPLDFSLDFLQERPSFKFEAKELDSTFGEQAQFSFKRQQPKRKINVRNLPSQNTPSNLGIAQSPTTKSLLFRNNSPRGRSMILSKGSHQNLSVKEPRKQWGLDDFILLGKMGQGSYSEVFRAIQKKSGWICALKVLSKMQIKQLEQENNVVREVKINLFCEHPNITKLYGYFCDEKNIYLVCEYACHRNLFQSLYEPRLKLRKGFMSGVAANYARQICSAVSYLHQNQLMHRDIKPENILITHGTIKLCDFGWAIHNPTRQLRSTLCGTPLYLAPQLISQQDYSEAVDIWAIGVITYEMLTEDIPFTISKPSQLYKIVSDEIKIERIRNRQAADFISKALQKDANKRVNIDVLCSHPFLNG